MFVCVLTISTFLTFLIFRYSRHSQSTTTQNLEVLSLKVLVTAIFVKCAISSRSSRRKTPTILFRLVCGLKSKLYKTFFWIFVIVINIRHSPLSHFVVYIPELTLHLFKDIVRWKLSKNINFCMIWFLKGFFNYTFPVDYLVQKQHFAQTILKPKSSAEIFKITWRWFWKSSIAWGHFKSFWQIFKKFWNEFFYN